MTGWQTVRRRVVLAGRVTSGRTGDPLEGVAVRLVKVPPALELRIEVLRELGPLLRGARRSAVDRTSTAADGTFFFVDLPPGDYEIAAEAGAGRPDRRSESVSVELVGSTGEGDHEPRIPHVELTWKES